MHASVVAAEPSRLQVAESIKYRLYRDCVLYICVLLSIYVFSEPS